MVEARSLKQPTESGNKEDLNPTKFYSKFLFKALILALVYSVVPVFLSQSPELANQTRLLELLHLVFVGIAVSYGLFSRRNYDGGGRESNTNDQKPDHNNNSYVPKILEISSVFNVEHESESEPSDYSSGDHRKFQTWRNKYQIKIPEVSSGIREKPLLLPVRSLNYSRVSDSDPWEKVRSKRQLLKSLGDDNSDVLPSPIPWRSRSFSSSKEIDSQPSDKNPASFDLQPLIKTRANLTPSSSFSSPRKTTPLADIASEPGAKSYGEFHPPPPPPPPPPLPDFYDSESRKENRGISRIERRESVRKSKLSGGESHHPPPPPPPLPPLPDFYNSASRKEYPGIYRIDRRESVHKTKSSGGDSHPPPPPPPPPLPDFYNSSSRKESVNNTKFPCCEFHPQPPPPPPPPPPEYYKSIPTKSKLSSERRKPSEQKMKSNDNSSKRTSPKKVWWSDPIAESKENRMITENTEKTYFLGSKASEETKNEEHRNKENEIHEEEKKREEEEGGGGSNNGSDVDKKADEFIAKFREQIRLQRIESIKRSANKISANSSRLDRN